MKMSDIIFVASVQHTGTWFTLRNLAKFLPGVQIKELTFIRETLTKAGQADVNYEYTYEAPLTAPTLMQIHLPIDGLPEFSQAHSQWFRNWYSNLGTLRSLPVQTILLICNFFKTVIPVRDPIAAILTRETRHPQFDHHFIINGYIDLAMSFMKHPNVKFLPIDLNLGNSRLDIAARRALFQEVLIHCEVPLNSVLIDEVARSWSKENITPGNYLRELYEAGNIAQLRKELGPKWSEIRYAQQMYPAYEPLMASLGYNHTNMFKGLT